MVGGFVGCLCGWNLLGAYDNGVIRTRGSPVSRKKSPQLFWVWTGLVAIIFGVLGVGLLMVGLGAPAILSFPLGATIASGTIIVIARAHANVSS
jgi:hypothetical protein